MAVVTPPPTITSASAVAASVATQVVHAPKYGDILGVDMVDIYVGLNRKLYRVHKNILCIPSTYFSKIFNNGSKETALPKLDPYAFDLFLEWIYAGGFRTCSVDIRNTKPDSGPVVDLIKLYGFAEFIGMPDLIDFVATTIITILRDGKTTLSIQGIALIYEATSSKSKLRDFAAECFRYLVLVMEDDSDEENSCWSTDHLIAALTNADLARDLFVTMRGITGLPGSAINTADCRFHVHARDEICKFKFDYD